MWPDRAVSIQESYASVGYVFPPAYYTVGLEVLLPNGQAQPLVNVKTNHVGVFTLPTSYPVPGPATLRARIVSGEYPELSDQATVMFVDMAPEDIPYEPTGPFDDPQDQTGAPLPAPETPEVETPAPKPPVEESPDPADEPEVKPEPEAPTVRPEPKVESKVVVREIPKVAEAGEKVLIKGRASGGERVVRLLKKTKNGWKVVARVRTNARGFYRLPVPTGRAGKHRFRVVVNATPTEKAVSSKPTVIRVRRG
ncbi:hypothetical protein [Nocardioides pakistanensis]